MSACTDPACARLREELRTALLAAQADLDAHRRLRTLGGPPPPYTPTWTPGSLPGGPEPGQAHIGARTSGTTEGSTS